MLPWPGPLALKVTFGRSLMTSSKVVIVIWASESPVSAWIVIGTFWTDSARRCAVTTTSASSTAAAAPEVVSAGAANTTLAPGAHRIAATAAEIFELGFIALTPVDPQGLFVISHANAFRLPRWLPIWTSLPSRGELLE